MCQESEAEKKAESYIASGDCTFDQHTENYLQVQQHKDCNSKFKRTDYGKEKRNYSYHRKIWKQNDKM